MSLIPCGEAHPATTDASGVVGWCATGVISDDLPSWTGSIGGHRLASAVVEATALEGESLERAALAAFSEAIDRLGAPPTRTWAFLSRITEPDREGLDRYMRMNLGRGRAYRRPGRAVPFIPAGTCTGHAGGELVVHAIHLPGPARPVENPRQRPAWSYSSRFGPEAPPFTRGVVVADTLIASGTASVVGEETRHEGDLRAQWDESLANLEALRRAAAARGGWRSLQVYVRDAGDLAATRELARRDFGGEVERVVLAPLCRAGLLVEIEGVCDA